MKLNKIEDVISDVRQGKMVVIIDDADRENEGDLMVAAEKTTAEHINFMMQDGKGLICLSLTIDRLRQLNLPFQVQHNTSPFGTNFAVSFDHVEYSSVGNSAEARAFAIRAATNSDSKAEDFIKPGHVFPLGAVDGGVLKRRGQTEGSLDISRLAGLSSAGVICEIMDSQGVMLRGESLQEYCSLHNLKITSVAEIIDYILKNEVSLSRVSEVEFELSKLVKNTNLSSKLYTYLDYKNNLQHYALKVGNRPGLEAFHIESPEHDILSDFFNNENDFKNKLNQIIEDGAGVLVFLREGVDKLLAQYIYRDLNSHLN